jgi:hypothetical protein
LPMCSSYLPLGVPNWAASTAINFLWISPIIHTFFFYMGFCILFYLVFSIDWCEICSSRFSPFCIGFLSLCLFWFSSQSSHLMFFLYFSDGDRCCLQPAGTGELSLVNEEGRFVPHHHQPPWLHKQWCGE